ncbi:MAG: serine/threonine protein kinase [Myxococcales bacterium]|nr:serine/threonine protein kinase [Myxococcales bacterium]
MIERVGNYRITDEIGSGGMAVVYKGVQESLDRVVAIKALKTSMSDDENVVARFEREALSVASFQHENIITLYDFFKERGALFMVMEFVEGIDLYDLLERCDAIPTDVAAIIALQVARGLDYAHFRGVIHRDVKPANVILSKQGEVKLMDFGIARVEQSDLTEAGIGLGTPAYMSPEQIIGDRLDHRSDIWSLGVLLYQMVTGRKPWVEDDQRTVMQRIRLEEAELPRKLNPKVKKELERIILKCMQKSPRDRYDSTQDLVIALEQYLAVHVQTNYRARMVTYLRDVEVLDGDETQATLHPALLGTEFRHGVRVRRRRTHALPLLLLLVGLGGGAAGGVFYSRWQKAANASNGGGGGHVTVHTGSGGGTASTTVCAPGSGSGTARVPTGKLKLLVQPWADVELDGKKLGSTPMLPVDLPVGKHHVKLTNNYFQTVEVDVEIRAGETTKLQHTLKRNKGS